jgi:general secretion pathway protein K
VSAPRNRSRRQARLAPPSRQRGIALLVAVLLVALGTIVAAAVAYENAMTARRGTATYAFDQSVLIAQGAEAIAAYGLRQVVQQDPKNVYIGQGWDKPYGPLEVVPGVMLEASLEDLQGRFNLNNLVKSDGTPDTTQVAAFNALLALVGLEQTWSGYIIDWIDRDTTPSIPEGAEDSVYMGQTLPYRTPNRYITSASELLALPGFGHDRYVKLAPYVTALPHGTTLNVCTAKDVVLDAYLGDGKTDFSGQPGQLAKNRASASTCFPTIQDYQAAFSDPKIWSGTNAPGQPASGGLGGSGTVRNGSTGGVQKKVGTTSSYFGLTSLVTIGSTEFNLYSLLYQDAQQHMVRPIQRSFTPEPRLYDPVVDSSSGLSGSGQSGLSGSVSGLSGTGTSGLSGNAPSGLSGNSPPAKPGNGQ